MATIYVRKSGNDSTGNGSTATPYLTLKKALSVAASGDLILMGAGAYAEDSGSGYLQIGSVFTAYVQIWPESGVLGDVTISGAGATWAVWIGSTNFVSFHAIVFRSQASTVQALVRLLGGNMADITFDRCRFEVIGQSGATNLAVATAWTGSGYAIARIAFLDCEIREIGPYYTGGIILDNAGTGTVTDVQIVGSRIAVGNMGVRLLGLVRCAVVGNRISALSSLTSGTALQLGVDGASGAAVTGVVTGNTVIARLGHATVIGAGSSEVIVEDNVFYGGSNGSAGQGLVIKNATGARVRGNTVHGGALSGLYLKACQGCLIQENTVHNRFATSPALRVGINPEDNSRVANNVVRGNFFHAPVGTAISWDGASGDAGGNVVDQNVYSISGAASFGTVRGTVVTTLAELRTAWAGYDEPYNDAGSRTGFRAPGERGNRSVVLAA